MESRPLGRTGRSVGVVGLGCWQLGADWGSVDEDVALGVLAAAVDAGRDVPRHRRRVRRRALREAHRRVPGRPRPEHGLTVATKMGRRADPHTADAYTLVVVPRVDRPLAREPRRRHPRPGAAALPAVGGLPPRVHLRRPGRARRRGPHRRLRRLRRDRRRGARRDHPAARRHRADHPQRVPPQAAGGGAARRRGRTASASSRACPLASGLLSGQVRRAHAVRRRRPPVLQPRTARRSTWARRSPGVPFEVGVAAAREVADADARRVRRPRSWPCGGSSTSPACPSSSPARAPPEQAVANAAAAALPPIDEETLDGLRGVYDGRIRPHVHAPLVARSSATGRVWSGTFLRDPMALSRARSGASAAAGRTTGLSSGPAISMTRGNDAGGGPNALRAPSITCLPSARAPATPTTRPMPNGMMRPMASPVCLVTCVRTNRRVIVVFTLRTVAIGIRVSSARATLTRGQLGAVGDDLGRRSRRGSSSAAARADGPRPRPRCRARRRPRARTRPTPRRTSRRRSP